MVRANPITWNCDTTCVKVFARLKRFLDCTYKLFKRVEKVLVNMDRRTSSKE